MTHCTFALCESLLKTICHLFIVIVRFFTDISSVYKFGSLKYLFRVIQFYSVTKKFVKVYVYMKLLKNLAFKTFKGLAHVNWWAPKRAFTWFTMFSKYIFLNSPCFLKPFDSYLYTNSLIHLIMVIFYIELLSFVIVLVISRLSREKSLQIVRRYDLGQQNCKPVPPERLNKCCKNNYLSCFLPL